LKSLDPDPYEFTDPDPDPEEPIKYGSNRIRIHNTEINKKLKE